MPGEPATMATAACHLCESTARGSSHCRTSSSVTRWARARLTSSPMSATSISPVATEPGGRSRPGFSAANVTVRSAGSTPSPAAPVSAVDPARDVDGEHRGVAHVGRRPRSRGSPVP